MLATRAPTVQEPDSVVVNEVREAHPDVVTTLDDIASRIATAWPDTQITEGSQARTIVAAAVESVEIRQHLPVVLESAVGALDAEMAARPVPAPPYVVVTSTGVVLRATTSAGRLVVRFECVEYVDDQYRPLGESRISVRLHGTQ